MNPVIIYGVPQSSYARTVRLVCEEKRVPHVFESVGIHDLRSPAHMARHPFGRIPAMRHGGVLLFETLAIARYIDVAFDGPALQPKEAHAVALMDQWISVTSDYVFHNIARRILVERFIVPELGGTPDEQSIAAALPDARHCLETIDQALGSQCFLAGAQFTLADMFLSPIIFNLGLVPEGDTLLAGLPALERWYKNVSNRPSFAATMPPTPNAKHGGKAAA
ncbi:MAG: glutathione S-transferase family protein [Alphaproteobacteria bacterium]|nr:glutathione S-transferase family protein [Alphaproteobacteria bacterium]